ncbi:hypothetical protein PanWU01x14_106600, partial [Parasponia andersonii]
GLQSWIEKLQTFGLTSLTTHALPAVVVQSRMCTSYGYIDVLPTYNISDLVQDEAKEKQFGWLGMVMVPKRRGVRNGKE